MPILTEPDMPAFWKGKSLSILKIVKIFVLAKG